MRFTPGSSARRRVRGPLFALTLALLLPCATPRAEIVKMVSLLTGAQDGVVSDALGVGHYTIDTDANTLDYEIRFGGLSSSETAAHFHGPADPGVDAGPIHTLALGAVKTGTWNYDEGQEADILGGRVYVNVHSSNHAPGEIRGQVVDMVALLDAAQEDNSSNTSTASGVGLFMIDRDANTLDYYILFDGLVAAESAAHIHGLSLHGTASSPLHTLAAGSPKDGSWNYNENQEAAILSGLTYVNVHSTTYPGGEIRGQITNNLAFLDAAQEGGSVSSNAYGVASFSHDPANLQLGYYITYADLTSAESVAHIHGYAAPGSPAGPLHTLPTSNPKLGVWDYLGALAGPMDQLYVNIHTSNNPGGEIRGQLQPVENVVVPVELSTFGMQ